MGSLHPLVALPEQLLLASNVISKAPSGFGPGQGTPCSEAVLQRGVRGDGCLQAGCCSPSPRLRSGQPGWMRFQGNRQAACTGMRSEAGWGEHGGDTPEPGMVVSWLRLMSPHLGLQNTPQHTRATACSGCLWSSSTQATSLKVCSVV